MLSQSGMSWQRKKRTEVKMQSFQNVYTPYKVYIHIVEDIVEGWVIAVFIS